MACIKTDFKSLNLVSRGKVRDIYAAGDRLLIVATDRISAFDVVMPTPIPDKGKILTQMSVFWFRIMEQVIETHLISADADEYPEECRRYTEQIDGRSMLVKKAAPLPVECIVRGYLTGSGWKDYSEGKAVSGIQLPQGLKEFEKLPAPIFTPTTKAEAGTHDLPITRNEMADRIGTELTEKVIAASLEIYNRASVIADQAGIIIADTKMEFGIIDGRLILIDELLTPDSSRFWPKIDLEKGRAPSSFDKQYLRDYLLSIQWNREPPSPVLPAEIVEKTRERYQEVFRRIVREKAFLP
ncbi:MAG: phosphoribosylaminoimidazolesuccinocarboxamide synthase [Syntrophales bacterium]|jgi:phosphoribosylaminoimidazole-succinocarboxamide synthase|nr:phosphoribosylaminoimidazolesuccinocarboxamide synthase [Syntrophales bacterium]MDY0045547.1 phosphoribosylaminoimidazolesuccinocarboxamide synthase [Syntrophales bacterium]